MFKQKNMPFFILAAAVLIRLVNISMPLLEGTATRQIQTAMVARNFFIGGFNIFYPQVDFLGPGPGYLVLEFPFLSIITAFFYHLTGGVHEWFGRIINILFFTGSGAFLYALAKRLFETRTAMAALVVFCFSPLSIIYSRVFMPDFTMIFFSMGSLYLMFLWSESGSSKFFWGSAIFTVLAVLSKIHAFYLCVPLVIMLWQRERAAFLQKPRSWAYLLIVIVPAFLWYVHAKNVHQVYSQAEAYNFEISNWFDLRFLLNPKSYIKVFEQGWLPMLTPVGIALFLAGLLIKPEGKQKGILYGWLAGTFVYAIVFSSHMPHAYYNLPFLPITSIFVGRAAAWISEHQYYGKTFLYSRGTRFFAFILTFLMISVYAAYAYVVPRGYAHIPRLSRMLEEMTVREDLLVTSVPDGHATLYYSSRKGWSFDLPAGGVQETKDAISSLESMREEGGKYFVSVCEPFLKQSPDFERYLRSRYRVVKEEQNLYTIFSLE